MIGTATVGIVMARRSGVSSHSVRAMAATRLGSPTMISPKGQVLHQQDPRHSVRRRVRAVKNAVVVGAQGRWWW